MTSCGINLKVLLTLVSPSHLASTLTLDFLRSYLCSYLYLKAGASYQTTESLIQFQDSWEKRPANPTSPTATDTRFQLQQVDQSPVEL